MSLLFTAIANTRHILVDTKKDGRAFVQETENYLNRPNNTDQEVFYNIGNGRTFHAYSRNGLSVICVTDDIVPRTQCQTYLRQVFSNFTSNSDRVSRAYSAGLYGFELDYCNHLSLDASNFHMHAENTQLAQLRTQANEVIVIAGQNVEQLFERQNRLEDLNSKADQLKNEAQLFQRTSNQVSRHYWWANFKIKLIIGVVVFVILFVILMIILWQAGAFNKGSSTTAPTTASTS